jgi:glutamate carboxypeptidase
MQAGAPGTGGLATIDTLGVRGGGLHTRQEWIDLESLVERCQLLGVLLSRLAEGRVAAERVS